MKIKWAGILFCIVILAACAPSLDAVTTAIAQTQAANPTTTHTIVPTQTPKPTSTPQPTNTSTPFPTPDVRVIDIDPRKLLLEKTDLPTGGKYLLPDAGWISPSTNAEIVSSWTVEEGRAYLAETGRIHGWWVDYMRGTNNVVMPGEVYNNVVLYSTIEGAQLVVTKYGDMYITEDGYQEIDFSVIGDTTRAFTRSETDSSGGTRVWLQLIFSYRNIYHSIVLWGWENEVSVDFAVDIAEKLLQRLKGLPLSTAVQFTP